MTYPIIAYGHPVLRKKALEIVPKDYPHLKEIISNMYETLNVSRGIGLAAPQVGISIRLFIVDCSIAGDAIPELNDFKKVFLNPIILEENGEDCIFKEGCLSIPGILEDIVRKQEVKLAYYDEEWNAYETTFKGLVARVIQHEYDHIEGRLFIDRMMQPYDPTTEKKMHELLNGKADVNYEINFFSTENGS